MSLAPAYEAVVGKRGLTALRRFPPTANQDHGQSTVGDFATHDLPDVLEIVSHEPLTSLVLKQPDVLVYVAEDRLTVDYCVLTIEVRDRLLVVIDIDGET